MKEIVGLDNNQLLDSKYIVHNKEYLSDILEKVNNLPIIKEGLTFNNVTYHEGGYFKIGKIVIVSLKIVPTRTGLYFPVSGLPKARVHDTSLNIVNDTDGTANSYFAIVTNDGKLQINVPTASKTYSISGVYVCTD